MSQARSFLQVIARLGRSRVAIGACAILVLTSLAGVPPAGAVEPTAPVNLATAAGFSVVGSGVTNTGTGTVLALDLGAGVTPTGFPPGEVGGVTHTADAAYSTAEADRQAAYDAVAARRNGTAFSGDLGGTTFTPGLYSSAAAVTNTGTVTLDAAGDPNAIFVFQVGAALSSAASTKVVLTNGALANNVYWQVVGAVALGAHAEFVGTLLGGGAVSFGDGASLKGRVLTPSTVALSNSPITQPIDDLVAPLVSIDGGAARSTNDTTPPISGTTDEPGTPLVTVTAGSQVLSARAVDGVWSMSAGALTPGPHTVGASVTDPSGNRGTASQTLTVDTSAPGVTITGGPTTATNDTTPTISGTTDEPGTPRVTVTVGGQTLTTTADAGGAWAVDAGALTETSHSVRASVSDAAGNTGTDSQVLTVDVTVPVLTISGGPTRSTSDTSPWTYGTTAEKAGTIVQVSLGGQALTATVQSGGTWGVSAQTLASGTYTVLAQITDAAGNVGSMTQALTVGSATAPVTPPVSPPPVTPPVSPPGTPGTPSGGTLGTPPGAGAGAGATYRPDVEIRLAGRTFVGRGIYDVTRQRVTSSLNGHRARAATFEIRMTNRGNAADRMSLRGTRRNAQFTVAYLRGRSDVTAQVLSGRYRSATLRPGQTATLTVRIIKVRGAASGSSRAFSVRTTSAHDHGKVDTVAAVVKVVRG